MARTAKCPTRGWSRAPTETSTGQPTRGGPTGDGSIFRITPSGILTTLYSFCSQGFPCTDGENPSAGLVRTECGDFYGTTFYGGANAFAGPAGGGTIFKITPRGALTTLYTFCSQSGCADGANPYAGLVQAADGNFYGTTSGGGANGNYGTIFKITPSGTLTTIYSFCSQIGCADGENPNGLVQAYDGDFYGTTAAGGSGGWGTVFRIAPNGTLTTLHSFCSQSGCPDGAYPFAGLVQATNGDFYGTAWQGGARGRGMIFKITPGGTLTTLYSFCSQSGCADGANSEAALIQATNGDFYGTTQKGGADHAGTIFEITPGGTLTTHYSFCSQNRCTDGEFPGAGLIQAANGDFYGTTQSGGELAGYGTVFRLCLGLAPFVETQPASGRAGAVVKTLGTDLTGASSVTFGGVPAVFGVSPSFEAITEIAAIVPAGARSGKVQVVTPGGTLSSGVPFRVLP